MIKKFIYLEWKAFTRSASFGANLAMKILIGFLMIYFSIIFIGMGVGAFYILKKLNLEPLSTVNKFLIYYFLFDLVIRLLMQAIPVLNIKPLLVLPFKKPTIVHFSLGKTALSFFNWVHAFFFLPFSIVLAIEGYDIVGIIVWHFAILSLIYINNFLNIILSNIDKLFVVFIGIILALGAAQYYKIFDITTFTAPFFQGLYNIKWLVFIPVLILIGLYAFTFKYFKNNLYLDAGLSKKEDIATTENLSWLNQFGTLGTFLKNDIKLIKRNKRSKTTILMSVLFLFYGLIFFGNSHQPAVMHIFAGIFVSGGFLFVFGQFVPSWDSSYYQLMMTQNIPYRGYITSKWWLVVIATFISTILASFYLFYGWEIYLTIVVGAIYNIGVNSHLVLLGGAFTKTPIDLSNAGGAFGDKKAFNVNAMLLTLPKLLLPVALYGLGLYLGDKTLGLLLVAGAGFLGFILRNKVFSLIEKRYKMEKYSTISAYKQKS
ncbi:hypothetical protein D0809_04560 [Flavobacterium circumlabens]|uniref:Uncharacterized protein n=1 Tax=Flavobacterium circumlabens TaxID=2133765 RepID=A0A4Y7UJE5_9FLAO|nr:MULTISPECIES: DUF5687 family protein [Flavobacterium]QSB27311.1 hypothetical protein HAV12_000795 [Flavobacterium sp. CLA17]TCN61168.1 hypothetical protein EV142_101755 [Flavobacterium circumlabens]TEB46271.1 hypothetical protein D0809_04560 [Flavobacterium circumlabens]